MTKLLSKEEIKAEEKRLYEEYKAKVNKLKQVEKEQKAVGTIFTKGLLPIYVMFILSLGPTNGNDISTKIGERTRGLWLPSTGGIYPILKKLEKSGFIEGIWDDPKKKNKKVYSLTNIGIENYENKKLLLKDNMKKSLMVFKIIYDDLYRRKNN